MGPLRVGILMSRVRVEEKLLLERAGASAASRSCGSTTARSCSICTSPWQTAMSCWSAAINHLRALYALRMLNDWGMPTVNTYEVANNCGDKLLRLRRR